MVFMKNFKLLPMKIVLIITLLSVGLIVCSDAKPEPAATPQKNPELQKVPDKTTCPALSNKGPIARATGLPAPIVTIIALFRGPRIIARGTLPHPHIFLMNTAYYSDGSYILTTMHFDANGQKYEKRTTLSQQEADYNAAQARERTNDLRNLFGSHFIPNTLTTKANYFPHLNRLAVTQDDTKKLFITSEEDSDIPAFRPTNCRLQ